MASKRAQARKEEAAREAQEKRLQEIENQLAKALEALAGIAEFISQPANAESEAPSTKKKG